MAITSSAITPDKSLEEFRVEFNKLVQDVDGVASGTTAADDISIGDAAVTIATSTGNITIDAQAGDTDIIFKGTDGSSDITALTLDMSDAGKAIFNGAISATTITLSADGGVIVPDDGNIGSASSTAAMQIASTGIVTFVDDILIKDGGTIGVASSTSAITIASTGIVTLVDDLILKDAATIGVTSSTSAISIASTGIVTFVDDIVIIDGGTIGTSTDADAITIAAAGAVTFSQRDVHSSGITVADDGQIGSASDADSIAIAANGVVTFSQAPVFPDGSIALVDLDIDGGTDIGADLATTDLIIVDDGAGGTNRKAALSRIVTLTSGEATALAIALG
jgi:flagellar basal body rod protein FlgF